MPLDASDRLIKAAIAWGSPCFAKSITLSCVIPIPDYLQIFPATATIDVPQDVPHYDSYVIEKRHIFKVFCYFVDT
jgi:hypothetical protein